MLFISSNNFSSELQTARASDHLRSHGATRFRVPHLPQWRGQVRLPTVGGGRQPGVGGQVAVSLTILFSRH